MPQDCQNIPTDLKLIREGVSQAQRMLAALKPTYVPVDERVMEHYVVFAKKYAKFLKYFDTPDIVSGNWQSFFDNDPLVAIATSITDLLDKTRLQEATDVQATLKGLRTQLTQSLQQNNHQPHYTLFLAFVRLLVLLQEKTNTLTTRHLDFYYREVLQLQEKPAQPSAAHLLVELSKNTPDFSIAKDTAFKAGKDGKNNDAFFTNDRDLIANQAKVAALKCTYIKEGRLYAPAFANTDNGLEPALTSPDGAWDAFKNDNYEKLPPPTLKDPARDEIGFAVASHYLFLTGGTRTITLNIDKRIAPHCTAYLTTEKGWWLAKSLSISNNKLQIILTGDDPAIVPYNAKTHGGNFQTQLPMLRIMLNQASGKTVYNHFKSLDISSLKLTVQVENLKNLAVSNDFGPVDISKPFQPFGALPQSGSALVVGSKELFQKNYSTANLKIKWQNTPVAHGTLPKINISLLQKGTWSEPNSTGDTPFGDLLFSFAIPSQADDSDKNIDFTENEVFTASSKNGFVKLSLADGFGFTAYQTDLAKFLAKIPNANNPGPVPIAPTIDDISLSYTADDTNVAFFHIAPFGHKPVIIPTKLFPQFESEHQVEPLKNSTLSPNSKGSVAEFYIGILDLKPSQNLSLLFQVADGTAYPLALKPQPHLYWSYLSDNVWVPFQKDQINDNTGELLNSGIVTLSFPSAKKATANNTLMPEGLFWVKIAVKDKANAVCKLVTVAAQALKATFNNRQNDPTFGAQTLSAGTISKMEEPQAAVKKIQQPFAAFGGRGQETPEAFYTRVSERLRHRDRAIALWDYEHLILEAFPQIYQVKCLNHTRYEPNDAAGIYNELAPGHVTVVALPNQQFQKAINPLKPYTSLGVLSEVESFLRKRLSCFVKLHIKNPDFEEVKVDFKVKFHVGIDETYHLNLLKDSITRFLSPWAYGGPSPTFGGKIYQSALINFVEEQPYVDFVTDFKLLDKKGAIQNEISPSRAVSILVSVPKEQHVIQVIPEKEHNTITETCQCQA